MCTWNKYISITQILILHLQLWHYIKFEVILISQFPEILKSSTFYLVIVTYLVIFIVCPYTRIYEIHIYNRSIYKSKNMYKVSDKKIYLITFKVNKCVQVLITQGRLKFILAAILGLSLSCEIGLGIQYWDLHYFIWQLP